MTDEVDQQQYAAELSVADDQVNRLDDAAVAAVNGQGLVHVLQATITRVTRHAATDQPAVYARRDGDDGTGVEVALSYGSITIPADAVGQACLAFVRDDGHEGIFDVLLV